MTRLRKLRRLPAQERGLLLAAVTLLAAIRLGLALLPFRTVRAIIDRLTREALTPTLSQREREDLSPGPFPAREGETRGRLTATHEQIARAVTLAARHLPGDAACLPQALAAQALLCRAGYPADLRLGVARSNGGGLEAHAWVESDGVAVFGDLGLDRFTSLPPLPTRST